MISTHIESEAFRGASTQTLKAAFLQLRSDLEESARMSGAGWVRTYVQVVLPRESATVITLGLNVGIRSAR